MKIIEILLRFISFKYKVYTSFTYIAHLSDRLVILTSELQEKYSKNDITTIPYIKGKYAKIKTNKNIIISRKIIQNIMNDYNKPYFEDVSFKIKNDCIKLYINFKA